MTPETVLGQPALFRLTRSGELPADLSVRESRLLVGALNFHALMAPGRELTVHGYGGGWESLPRTTDDSTFNGLSRAYRDREFTIAARSLVPSEERVPTAGEARSLTLTSGSVRHIHVSRDSVLAFDPPRDISPSPVRRAFRAVRARTPLLYDDLRDIELLRHRRALRKPARRRRYDAEFEPGGIHDTYEIVPAPAVAQGAPGAVLFGLHWFELGGAERWAFESVRLAREAGLLPIVLTNRESHHPWVAREELDGALIIPFSDATSKSQTPGVEELLRRILRLFDVRGVVVHHNQWLYDRLHWIVRSRQGVPVVDSTHIVEYRGGGYPLSGALVTEAITTHHVISPTLKRWMVDVQGIDEQKVVMAPLGGLTVKSTEATFRTRHAGEPLTVAFIGRMARQKAPEVFATVAKHVRKSRDDVRFVMHGDGDMASWVDDLLRSYGLPEVVRRDSTVPVAETLGEAHVLVVPSHNEGLTLTTLEAVAQGVPVVSTDVGAQADIVPRWALVSRNARRAAAELAELVCGLADDEDARCQLWRDERKAEKKLLSNESASDWFAKAVRTW